MSDGAAATEEGTATETIPAMVLAAAGEREGSALRYRADEEWTELSYEDLGTRVREIACGLIALGVEPGDRVAIFADTRFEWTLCDLGALCAGAVVVAVYHTNSVEETRHVLGDSGSRVVFCEGRQQLGKVEEIRQELSDLEHVVLFDGSAEEVITLEELVERGADVEEGQVDERVEGISSGDLFSLIYTSSTTGRAKGCMLTHGNYRANLDMLAQAIDPGDDAVIQIGLPLAHTLTRMMQMLALSVGAELAFWSGDQQRLIEDLKEIRPTHYPATPRVFEKIHSLAVAPIPPEGAKGTIFEKLIETGRRVQDKEQAGRRPGPLLKLGHALADNEILSDVRGLFGGRLQLAITGAAPAPQHVLEFFYACGVLVVEGYGLTETSTVVAVNTPEDLRFGTVGKPLEGSEVRIAEEDGEILVRGPHVFRGYWGNEEETGEVLDEDGWLHTGDVGAIDEDGFLSITGRKKEILVTSSGENIPAGRIEAMIAESRWVSNAVVYGNERNHVVAIVTIDEDEREALADQTGTRDLHHDKMARQMVEDEGVRAEIQKAISAANEDLAPIEQVKKFAILERDLSVDEAELTPTMKVRRDVVYENYGEVFEGLYDDDEDG